MAAPTILTRIHDARPIAQDVLMLDLRPADGPLPSFEAGAHVDLQLADGLARSYSLANAPAERHRYVVAVLRSAASRGGSAFVHERLRAGLPLRISAPRNHFALADHEDPVVLIAGGIGITPIRSMIHRLEARSLPWQLHYGARTPAHAAFLSELEVFGPRLRTAFDQHPGGRSLDLEAIVAGAPAGAHFYCCGPAGMLSAFERATAALPRERVHLERFGGVSTAAAGADAMVAAGSAGASPADVFRVSLARSGVTFDVDGGGSILDALLERGIDVPYSCREGVCGSCEVGVLAGRPSHRDLVLGQAEREAGRTMMVCCSGCESGELILDL